MAFTTSELDFLAQAYGWDSVLRTSVLHEGENKSYAVTTPLGKYVLRVYRTARYTYTEVAAELEWLEALRGEVPVVPVLRATDDSPYVALADHPAKICAVFEYVDGGEVYPPSADDFEQLGGHLRRLHDAADAVLATKPPNWLGHQRPVYNLQRLVNSSLEPLLHADFLTSGQKGQCVTVAERLQRLYRQRKPEKHRFVHADLHFGNVLVSDHGWTLLDFDECGFGFCAFDLGTVRFHARVQGQLDEAWRAFRRGYGEPFPSEADIQLGTALRIFYTAGKIPLRLDIPELKTSASSFVERYLSMIAQELETAM